MEDAQPTDASPAIPADAVTLPASFAQKRLWFLHRLDPASPAYNIPCIFSAEGPLDAALLRACVAELVARHEALRTTFAEEHGDLLQVIHDAVEVPFETASFSSENEARAVEDEFVHQPFDLSRDVPIRVLLLNFGAVRHRLIFNIHHAVFDGSSLAIFLQELAAIFTARTAGRAPVLPELALQYGDFAAWQRDPAQVAALAEQEEFWRRRLENLPEPLALPEHRQPGVGENESAVFRCAIGAGTTAAFRGLCQQEGVTLFMGLLACVEVLLARTSGQERLLIGTPMTNRSRGELGHTIGLFVNTIIVRADTGGATVRRLIRQVKEEVVSALDYAELPFDRVVELAAAGPRQGRNPLFRPMFALQDKVPSCSLAGTVLRPESVDFHAAKADLLFEITDEGAGLSLTLSYARALFDPATVARMGGHLVMLMERMAATPDADIFALPMLTDPEKRQFAEWNDTARPFPDQQPIDELFRAQARRHPQKTALRDGALAVSYGELDAQSDAIAAAIDARGIAPGARIALPAERSARFVAAILGILKAGGVYVPIDPDEPEERAHAMRALCDAAIELEPASPGTPVARPRAATDAAYVLFTSGSTGTPKGVIVPHVAISRLVVGNDVAPLGEDDVVAFASNVCFDAATFEIWGALLNGATAVVFPRAAMLSPEEYERHATAHGVTTAFLTTALFNQFVARSPAMFRSFRTLIFGGEAADAAAAASVLEHGAPQRLVNAYGPTEVTTFATFHEICGAEGQTIPIGRPLTNTTAHVFDRHLNELPVDAIGELHLGGPGVALGYLGDPELTAQRFLQTHAGRLYQTGDLARWRGDGTLDFVGRRDSQVKIRGFRIETGEIEAVLRSHPAVLQAAVLPQKTQGRAQSLAAWLVPRGSERPVASELRSFLAAKLPAHMVPAAFVWVDALPLTRNGKLDARKLPSPDTAENPSAATPRDPVETGLAEIWREVLGRDGFSVNDDFFLVGGHSLLAIRLLGLVRDRFHVDVPVARLFETPTIAGLADFISERLPALTTEASGSLVMIQKGSERRRPLFFVPGGWGGEIEFLVYAELVRHMDRSQPLYGLRARTSNNDELPSRTVEEFAADFIRDIVRFQPEGPYMIGGECVGGVLAYEVVRQLEAAGHPVSLLLLLDTEWPTDAGLRRFNEWETERREEEAEKHRRTPGQHLAELRQRSPLGMLRYAWRHFRPGALARQLAGYLGERERFVAWPRLLVGHALQPHAGRITFLLDEASSRSPLLDDWKRHHQGAIDVYVSSGDHNSYIREHAGEAASKIREIIAQAQTTTVSC